MRSIRTKGDPVLHTRTRQISRREIRSPKVKRLVSDLFQSVRETKGAAGFAANQIGVPFQVCVVDFSNLNDAFQMLKGVRQVLINPVIVARSEETEWRLEGCASLPGMLGLVERPKWIIVSYEDAGGSNCQEGFTGILGSVVQHEIDHLNGIMISDLTEVLPEEELRPLWENFLREQQKA